MNSASNPAGPPSLEEQLRSMILSNNSQSQPPVSNHQRASSSTTSHHPQGHLPLGRGNLGSLPPNANTQRPSHYQSHSSRSSYSGGQGYFRPTNIPTQPSPARNFGQTPITRSPQQQPRQHTPRTSHVRSEGHHTGYGEPKTPPQVLRRPQEPTRSPRWQNAHLSQSSPKLQNRMTQRGSPGPPSAVRPYPSTPPRTGYSARNQDLRSNESILAQCRFLDEIAAVEIPKVQISDVELTEKEAFRSHLEGIFQEALKTNFSNVITKIELKCFGSLSSGFATQGSDIDLAITPAYATSIESTSTVERDFPRFLEKQLLDAGLGARLLTRTRVPILKVCEKPTEQLYQALIDERQKWDNLPEEEKWCVSAPLSTNKDDTVTMEKPNETNHLDAPSVTTSKTENKEDTNSGVTGDVAVEGSDKSQSLDAPDSKSPKPPRNSKTWYREKVLGPLDFPKTGVGIQCDLNFSNYLAIENTRLLRCYSHCDPRVRPMVLFVKAWAKRRKVNHSYSGTLSSYGYVLMVLHFLVNIAQPPVIPNLQLVQQQWPSVDQSWNRAKEERNIVNGYDATFWDNEEELKQLAATGGLGHNNQPLGRLLRDFFHYYAVNAYGFQWTSEVLSLRTSGGLRLKQEKGWTSAKTTTIGSTEVRQRYLLAIEDPFELDHNVARTVTHYGIVAIRDEFRRAWRILGAIGAGAEPEGELFAAVIEESREPASPQPAKIAVPPGIEQQSIAEQS